MLPPGSNLPNGQHPDPAPASPSKRQRESNGKEDEVTPTKMNRNDVQHPVERNTEKKLSEEVQGLTLTSSPAKPNSARICLFSKPEQGDDNRFKLSKQEQSDLNIVRRERLACGFDKLMNNFHRQFSCRSDALKNQLDNSNDLGITEKFWKDVQTLRNDQTLIFESLLSLRKKIEDDQNQETKELCLEIYSYCCMSPFGLLDPVIGLSNTSLEWYKIIQNKMSEMKCLNEFLSNEREEIHIGDILPRPASLVWEFTKFFSPNETKVVIIGQDPYPTDGKSDGLGFSSTATIKSKIPPSLKQFFKAMELDKKIYFSSPNHGSLKKLAQQGVLMLDAALTVKKRNSKSHLYPIFEGQTSDWKSFKDTRGHPYLGWEDLVKTILEYLAKNVGNVVFMFWGAVARELISDEIRRTKDGLNRNLILEADHPMVGVYNETSDDKDYFLNCHHFSKANEFLREVGKEEIDWTIPNI